MGLAKVLRSRQSTASIFLASRVEMGRGTLASPPPPLGGTGGLASPPRRSGLDSLAGALIGLTLVELVLPLAL